MESCLCWLFNEEGLGKRKLEILDLVENRVVEWRRYVGIGGIGSLLIFVGYMVGV